MVGNVSGGGISGVVGDLRGGPPPFRSPTAVGGNLWGGGNLRGGGDLWGKNGKEVNNVADRHKGPERS